MRDAADATHALQGISPAVLKVLLAFVYEGKCETEEGLLTEVLEASARLVVDALKDACAAAIKKLTKKSFQKLFYPKSFYTHIITYPRQLSTYNFHLCVHVSSLVLAAFSPSESTWRAPHNSES